MNCELCGIDPDLIMLLPLRQTNGKLDTMACPSCAEKSSAFCVRHNRIHQGFIDGTTACITCIEELVKESESNAANIYLKLVSILDDHEKEELKEAAMMSSELTGSRKEISVLRFLATKARRTNQTINEVMDHIERGRKSLNYLLL